MADVKVIKMQETPKKLQLLMYDTDAYRLSCKIGLYHQYILVLE